MLSDLNAQCVQAEQRRLESKAECEAVQSTRVNIERIVEAEAKELERIAELEKYIESEERQILGLFESDEAIEL